MVVLSHGVSPQDARQPRSTSFVPYDDLRDIFDLSLSAKAPESYSDVIIRLAEEPDGSAE
jgi:hypothetical protein